MSWWCHHDSGYIGESGRVNSFRRRKHVGRVGACGQPLSLMCYGACCHVSCQNFVSFSLVCFSQSPLHNDGMSKTPFELFLFLNKNQILRNTKLCSDISCCCWGNRWYLWSMLIKGWVCITQYLTTWWVILIKSLLAFYNGCVDWMIKLLRDSHESF